MKVYLLCDKIQDRKDLHSLLQTVLSFPECYGNNLDALMDYLTDIQKPVHMVICDFYTLNISLGEYAIRFLEVCERAAAENPNFTFDYARKDCLFQ